MKNVLKLEELMMFLLGIFAFGQLNFSWWLFLVLILLPDISMLGYLANAKIGAISYNLFHHKGIAILFFLIGACLHIEIVKLFGVILSLMLLLIEFLDMV